GRGRSTSRTRSSHTGARRTGCGRRRRTSRLRREAQPQRIEPVDRLVEAGVEDAGDRPQVVTPYGEDPPVEILPLHLDHLQVADEHLRGRAVELAEPGQVDRDAASVDGRVGEVDDVGSPVAFLARQELVDGHLVEAGEALQPRYRDRTLAPLVRAEHRRLELLSRPGFDVLQREALLAANRPEALADLAAVASRVFQ